MSQSSNKPAASSRGKIDAPDVAALLGAGLLVWAAWDVAPMAAKALAGAFLLLAAWLEARSS